MWSTIQFPKRLNFSPARVEVDSKPSSSEVAVDDEVFNAHQMHTNLLAEYVEYKMSVANAFAEADQLRLVAAKTSEENDDLRGLVQDMIKSNEALSAQLAKVSNENDELKAKIEGMAIDHRGYLDSTQQVLAGLRTDVEQTHRENSMLTMENTSLRSDVKLLNSELTRSNMRCSELKAEIEGLMSEERDRVMRILQESDDKLDPDKIDTAFMQMQEQPNGRLEEKTSRHVDPDHESGSIAADLDQWRSEAAKLREELSDVSFENKNLQDCLTRLQEHVQKLEAENIEKSNELRKVQDVSNCILTPRCPAGTSRWLPEVLSDALQAVGGIQGKRSTKMISGFNKTRNRSASQMDLSQQAGTTNKDTTDIWSQDGGKDEQLETPQITKLATVATPILAPFDVYYSGSAVGRLSPLSLDDSLHRKEGEVSDTMQLEASAA